MEIERKFLVLNEDWKVGAVGAFLHQGYLNRHPQRSVRVRIKGQQAFLTIKGMVSEISRFEYEYPIPLADAQHMHAKRMADGQAEYQGKLLEARQSAWKDDVVLLVFT